MAGRPRLRQLKATIETLGGEDVVVDLLLEHGSFRKTAEALGAPASVLHVWMGEDPEREARFQAIREAIGTGMIEEILELIDEPPERNPVTGAIDAAWVALQTNRAKMRQWAAVRQNPSLRENPANTLVRVDVNAVVADLLHTLRERRSQRLVEGSGATIEGEVVSRPLLPENNA